MYVHFVNSINIHSGIICIIFISLLFCTLSTCVFQCLLEYEMQKGSYRASLLFVIAFTLLLYSKSTALNSCAGSIYKYLHCMRIIVTMNGLDENYYR